MSERRPTHVALILESAEEESLWLGAFASQAMPSVALSLEGDLERLAGDERIRHARAVLVDAPVLCTRGFAADAFAAFLMQRFPGIAVFVRLASRTGISAAEQGWARHAGIACLLPGSSVAAWQDSFAPVLSRVLAMIGRPKLDAAKLEAYLHELMRSGAEPRPGPVKDAYVAAFELERGGVKAGRLYDAMAADDGVAVADRTWRGRTYRDCFVVSQAIDWLVARCALDRATALRAMTFLWRTGRIHHVLRDAELHDDYLYFRFSGRRADLDRIDLAQLEAAMRSRGGVEIAERVHLSRSYPRCFVGEEAVDWIMARCGVPLGAAECMGQRLLELGVFHHVLDEHGFVAGRYFYRFRADETALA
jgi:hypothetical protein